MADAAGQVTIHHLGDAGRRFVLLRLDDETGVSGTGLVAWGFEFPDGKVVTRWCSGDIRQTCVWESVADVEAVHGHNGKTVPIWLDPEGGWSG